jgi:hypothetical protein
MSGYPFNDELPEILTNIDGVFVQIEIERITCCRQMPAQPTTWSQRSAFQAKPQLDQKNLKHMDSIWMDGIIR